eukprot:4944016-Alexandrium_andersonii.AAC.1
MNARGHSGLHALAHTRKRQVSAWKGLALMPHKLVCVCECVHAWAHAWGASVRKWSALQSPPQPTATSQHAKMIGRASNVSDS